MSKISTDSPSASPPASPPGSSPRPADEAPSPDSVLRQSALRQYVRHVEAVLFAAAEPLSPADIRTYAGEGDLGAALNILVANYRNRGINLVERGGRWLFQTAPDCAHVLEQARETPKKLSRAALETLAIIAYHEPATRAEIEEIRGVQAARGTLDTLLAAGFIRLAGRRETAGRPMQYATTTDFLAHFGLRNRRDLPGLAELKASGLLDQPAFLFGEEPADTPGPTSGPTPDTGAADQD